MYDDCPSKGGDSHDHDSGSSECGTCKGACADDNTEVIESFLGAGATFETVGKCKGACADMYDDCSGKGGDSHDHDSGDGLGELQGPYTVFAPTDQAFEELDALVGGLETVDPGTLCAILEFHVVAGEALSSSDLSCDTGSSTLIEMANGVDARIKCTQGVPYGIKGGGNDFPAEFLDVDIEASDGYVHVIDNVLFYPRVLDSHFGGVDGDMSGVTPSARADIP
jgi:hypothetical protein